jgi:hypothetical protein
VLGAANGGEHQKLLESEPLRGFDSFDLKHETASCQERKVRSINLVA